MRRRIEWSDLSEIFHQGKKNDPKGVTVVFGGQAGSEGKGAIAGWLARRFNFKVAISTFMPNAGHTWVGEDGQKVVVTQLPIALVSPHVEYLLLGASSVIDSSKLEEEINTYDKMGYNVSGRLRIHSRAQMLLPEYQEWEAENLRYIASTGKGCGAAIAAKARRERSVILAQDGPAWIRDLVDPAMDGWLNRVIDMGGGVLAEQSQGFDLDINHGLQYPYCTSRQCTPEQIMADIGVSGRMMTNAIAVVRTNPIRVGNVEDGYSGDYGSPEKDWETVSAEAGREVIERTTVTNRVRRVFEFDDERIADMSRICRPTAIALTFMDYVDPMIEGWTTEDFRGTESNPNYLLPQKARLFRERVERAARRPTYNTPVQIMKTGPGDHETIDLGIAL